MPSKTCIAAVQPRGVIGAPPWCDGECGRGRERLLGIGAVPPDVVGSSRVGKHGHAMVAIFVQLVHVETAIVHVFF